MQNHTKTFYRRLSQKKMFMICVEGNNHTRRCRKTFRASLGKFGQKSFAPSKIYLLLHLCMWVSKGSIPPFGREGWRSRFRALERFLNMSVLHSYQNNPILAVGPIPVEEQNQKVEQQGRNSEKSKLWMVYDLFIHSHEVLIKFLEVWRSSRYVFSANKFDLMPYTQPTSFQVVRLGLQFFTKSRLWPWSLSLVLASTTILMNKAHFLGWPQSLNVISDRL